MDQNIPTQPIPANISKINVRWLVVPCIILLISTISLSIFMWLENLKLNNQLAAKQQAIDQKTLEINKLDANVTAYFKAEGRTCTDVTLNCLAKFTKELSEKVGPECSSIVDSVCPLWCAAGADVDCCNDKGYKWIQGRGCYGQ